MYFKNFPVLPYPAYVSNNRTYVLAKNILRRVAFSDRVNSESAFIEYNIKDGERPEHIANRVYGNPNHHWLVLLANDITDPYYGWYMSQSTLEQYIQKAYYGVAVYFTETVFGGFTYSPEFFSGCTLSQNNRSDSIKNYRDTFCEFTIESPSFGVGGAVVSMPSGKTMGVYIHRVLPNYTAVHHFTVERPASGEGSSGAQEFPVVDPLSRQVADYEELPPVVGTQILPIGVGGVTGATVEFWETYIGKYMGVSGEEVDLYAVSNYTHEQDRNEKKRVIKILHPSYLDAAIKELKAALGV
jgi:hypothetical protein